MPPAQVDPTPAPTMLTPARTEDVPRGCASSDVCGAERAEVGASPTLAADAADPAGTDFFDSRGDVCSFDELVALLGKPRSTVYRWLQQRALVLDRTHMRVVGASSNLDVVPVGAALVVPEWGGVREAGAPCWMFRTSYVNSYMTMGFAHVMAALEAFHRTIRTVGDAGRPRRR